MSNKIKQPWKSLPGPDDITRVVLPNEIVILTRSNYSSPSVVISGYLSSGSQFDPQDKLGLAHFTALSLTRGTEKRNFQEIYDALESVGASMVFGASVHNANFGGRCLYEDLPLLLQILSETLRHPVFPEEQIDRLRGQILTNLAIRAQDTGEMASLAFDEIVFKDHPYGRPEDGFPDTIGRISQNDLVEFHHTHYGPKGMVIVVVGGIAPEEAIAKVQHALGDWRNPEQLDIQSLPAGNSLQATVRRHVSIPGKYQADLVIGMLGPKRASPNYMSASLGNNILGQFGMMGRIGDVVREQAGLAYYASTSLNAWIDSGSWEVSAGVNPANIDKATDLIIKELERFVNEPVQKDELIDSQSNFLGRLPLSLESNSGVAGGLLNLERFKLGLDYYQRYHSIVENVTPESILETARQYIDTKRLAIVSAGPD